MLYGKHFAGNILYVLLFSIFIYFLILPHVHGNTDLNNICTIRIDMIESLTKDGFLNNNNYLKQWFHHKYPTCQYNNYEMNIVEDINVKHSSKPGKDSIKTNAYYHYEKKHGNDIGIKVNQEMLSAHEEDNNRNKVPTTNTVNDGTRLGVFEPRATNRGMQLHRRRDIESARSLIGEWDGSATSGTFTLSNDVKPSQEIQVSGRLEIIGIISMDGKRPAIDGGGNPGCTGSNCPGHRVFSVENDKHELILSNLTIKNGWVSVYTEQHHIYIYIPYIVSVTCLFHFKLCKSIVFN